MADPRPWVLRGAEPGDAAFLRALYASTRPDLGLLPEAVRATLLDLQYRAQQRGYAANYPQARQEIVVAGETAAGQLLTAEQGDDLVLVDISLLPDWRGQGLGGAAIRTVQDRAQAAGRGVRLQVARDNPALRLYRRHGFGPAAEDEVRLTLHWSAPGQAPG
ncbi:GNAT family N-acetyltransferase [uncultured Deinococcus sp.]|uniref:GNAT family N-acetyltransferase n=1 Tax=uncultured Deinococcus sp. TaxID=158789 RepID=UPI0025877EC3|nr:GNAT family N-acetyltransferase [uncultured Deinococcus sp.]